MVWLDLPLEPITQGNHRVRRRVITMTIFFVCSGRWSTSLWDRRCAILSEGEGFFKRLLQAMEAQQCKPPREGRTVSHQLSSNKRRLSSRVRFCRTDDKLFLLCRRCIANCCCPVPGSSHKALCIGGYSRLPGA